MLDVVVRELAELAIVNADDLGVLGGAQGEAWDQIHDEEDNAGAEERVGETGDAVCKLVRQLDVMSVEPATIDFGKPVKVRYVIAVSMC